jgi:hypothetical protein
MNTYVAVLLAAARHQDLMTNASHSRRHRAARGSRRRGRFARAAWIDAGQL